MFDCSPVADDGGALDLSTVVFPSSSQEPVPPVHTLVISRGYHYDIHVNKWTDN